ncbi:hypothetical protein V8F33_008730 [Rhypophila sp. PSN 637]
MAGNELTPRDDGTRRPRRDGGQPEESALSTGREVSRRENQGREHESQPEEAALITGQEITRREEDDWEDEVQLEVADPIPGQEITTHEEKHCEDGEEIAFMRRFYPKMYRRSLYDYLMYFPGLLHRQVIRPIWQFLLSRTGLEVLVAITTILAFGRYRANKYLARTPPETLFLARQQSLFDYRPAPPAPPPPPHPAASFAESHPIVVSIIQFIIGTNSSSPQEPPIHCPAEKLELNSAKLPAGVLYYTRTTSPYDLLNGGWHRTQLKQMLPWELFFRSLRPNYTAITPGTEPITPFSSKEEIKAAALFQITQIQCEILHNAGIQILRPASSTPRRVYTDADYEDLSWIEQITARLYPFLVRNKLKGPYQRRFQSYKEEEKAMEADMRTQDPDNIHYRARDIIDALVLAHATLVNPAARCQYHLASETPDWYGVPVRGSCGKSETLVQPWEGHLEQYPPDDDLEWGSGRGWFSLGRWKDFIFGLAKRFRKEGLITGIGSWLGMGPGLETKTVEAYEKVYWWDVWKEQREQQARRRWRAEAPLLEVFDKLQDEGSKVEVEEEDKSWVAKVVPLWLRNKWSKTFNGDRLWENIILSEERRVWVKVFLFLVLLSGLAVRGYPLTRWLGRWLLVGFLWRYV